MQIQADDDMEEKKEKLLDDVDRRVTIAYLFVNKYKGLENLKDGTPMDNWRGRGGVISKIKNDMGKKLIAGVTSRQFCPKFSCAIQTALNLIRHG